MTDLVGREEKFSRALEKDREDSLVREWRLCLVHGRRAGDTPRACVVLFACAVRDRRSFDSCRPPSPHHLPFPTSQPRRTRVDFVRVSTRCRRDEHVFRMCMARALRTGGKQHPPPLDEFKSRRRHAAATVRYCAHVGRRATVGDSRSRTHTRPHTRRSRTRAHMRTRPTQRMRVTIHRDRACASRE